MENKLRILHICYSDNVGGASVAMFRLNDALIKLGVDSNVLTLVGSNEKAQHNIWKKGISSIFHNFAVRILGFLIRQIQPTSHKTTRSLNIFHSGLAKFINTSSYDIVNLHWIGNETISIKEIADIKKPIVWTMHDLWAILGAEHNNISQTNRYIIGYQRTNRPTTYKGWDLEKFVWNLKKKYWKNVNINIVAVSRWQSKVIECSSIFNDAKIYIINNAIDLEAWKPRKKDEARRKLGLDNNKKIILYGAFNFLSDPIKGFDLLKASLKFLNPDLVQFVYFGSEIDADFLNFEVHNFGKISDIELLMDLYSAADIFINPSLQETFGQTALEALSCNTPVVAFSGSGLDDIIVHKSNGFLATPYIAEELAKGVNWLLANNLLQLRDSLGHKFSQEFIGSKYLQLYKKLL